MPAIPSVGFFVDQSTTITTTWNVDDPLNPGFPLILDPGPDGNDWYLLVVSTPLIPLGIGPPLVDLVAGLVELDDSTVPPFTRQTIGGTLLSGGTGGINYVLGRGGGVPLEMTFSDGVAATLTVYNVGVQSDSVPVLYISNQLDAQGSTIPLVWDPFDDGFGATYAQGLRVATVSIGDYHGGLPIGFGASEIHFSVLFDVDASESWTTPEPVPPLAGLTDGDFVDPSSDPQYLLTSSLIIGTGTTTPTNTGWFVGQIGWS